MGGNEAGSGRRGRVYGLISCCGDGDVVMLAKLMVVVSSERVRKEGRWRLEMQICNGSKFEKGQIWVAPHM